MGWQWVNGQWRWVCYWWVRMCFERPRTPMPAHPLVAGEESDADWWTDACGSPDQALLWQHVDVRLIETVWAWGDRVLGHRVKHMKVHFHDAWMAS